MSMQQQGFFCGDTEAGGAHCGLTLSAASRSGWLAYLRS